jgi:hypothetical protein
MNARQSSGFGSGLSQFLGGLFGDSGAPYEDAMKQYEKYGRMTQDIQNPFLQAGYGAIPQFQEWLKGMQDPSKFINNLMGQYQESPWSKYQQQQSMRAAQNFGSATGLTGSTPLQLQAQQNAANISSQDMNQWLQNVLGINTQYGLGNQSLINTGQNSANALTNFYSQQAKNMAEAAYGKKAGEGQDFFNLIGGIGSLLFG